MMKKKKMIIHMMKKILKIENLNYEDNKIFKEENY